MLLITQLVKDYLPLKKKQTPKGWWQFNAVCCHHRGHNQDSRGRGNLMFSPDGSIVYKCYNCGFKAKHTLQDSGIGSFFERLMEWLGISHEKIQQAKLEILSKKISGEIEETSPVFDREIFESFRETSLPDGARPLTDWLTDQDPPEHAVRCMEYLVSARGRAVAEGWNYHWAPPLKGIMERKIMMGSRIIVPFMNAGKIVGWTARYAGNPPQGVPRYYNSDVQDGYLFNGDVISKEQRKFVLIHEGPFDAIATDGVAALGSSLNHKQIRWLNGTDKEKIVVPDLQARNQDLIDIALEQGWSVSFPEWGEKIKDAADASKIYGRLYTLASIISARTRSPLKIGVKRRMLKG